MSETAGATDLVGELRRRASIHTDPLDDVEWFNRAADEIEWLRLRLKLIHEWAVEVQEEEWECMYVMADIKGLAEIALEGKG